MAEESFCEVCGDAGGALSLVICENTDLGCLGGIHLYCCVPLRTEAPTDAWYCTQCSRARDAAAAAVRSAEEEAQQARKRRREQAGSGQRRQPLQEQGQSLLQLLLEEEPQAAQKKGPAAATQQAALPPQQQQQQADSKQQQQQQADGKQQQQQQADSKQQAHPDGKQQQEQHAEALPGSTSAAPAPEVAAAPSTAVAIPKAAILASTAAATPAAATPAAATPVAATPARTPGFAGSSGAAGRGPWTTPRQPGGLAAVMASLGSARGATPAATGATARRPVGTPTQTPRAGQAPAGVASKDTLAVLFDTLSKGDEASREQQRRMSRVIDGTSRRLQHTLSEREARWRAVQRQHTLEACRATRLHWRGCLQLPLGQEEKGSWGAWTICYGIPGNPHCADAARLLVPLADAAAAGQQPQPRLMSMDELGLRQDQAYQEASMLLALGQCEASIQQSQRRQWALLWEQLRAARQAVGIHIPPGPAAAAAAAAANSGGSGVGSTQGLFLALVPNVLDLPSKTLFGLLAVPLKLLARSPAHGAPARSILRQRQGGPQQAAAPAAAAAGGDGGAAKSSGSGSEDLPLAPPPARQTAAAGVAWADNSREDSPSAAATSALELGLGAHYATPRRRAVQAARPARLPAIRDFGASPGGLQPVPPKPLEGLRVALVGFEIAHELTQKVLTDLRELGASTHNNQLTVADVMMVHPRPAAEGLYNHKDKFPLGLAHLLASTGVHVYSDGGFKVLHDMINLRRPLKGDEWKLRRPIFPGGLVVVLDAPTLLNMPSNQLQQVLAHVQRLAAASEEPHWLWAVVAAPADLAALRGAAQAGRMPAAENWQLWQGCSLARPLQQSEMSSSWLPAVKHSAKMAAKYVSCCRLVFLCTSDPETLEQAELEPTILSGSPSDLLEFLATRQP